MFQPMINTGVLCERGTKELFKCGAESGYNSVKSFKSHACQSKGDGRRINRESRDCSRTFNLRVFSDDFPGLAFNQFTPLRSKGKDAVNITSQAKFFFFPPHCFFNTWELIAVNVVNLGQPIWTVVYLPILAAYSHIVAFPTVLTVPVTVL